MERISIGHQKPQGVAENTNIKNLVRAYIRSRGVTLPDALPPAYMLVNVSRTPQPPKPPARSVN